MRFVSILPNCTNQAYTYRQGNRTYLQSFETVIMSYDHEEKQFYRHWDEFTRPAGRHISHFMEGFSDWFGIKGVREKFLSLPYENLD